MQMASLIEKKAFKSRITTEKVTLREYIIGYFFSPAGTSALNAVLVTYVNIYYTDFLKIKGFWAGAFLVILPIVSKIISVLINVLVGRIIDKTRTSQGKARPWLLFSAPLVLLSSILLFISYNLDETWSSILILFLYNLCFSFSLNIYSMAHSLMVPLGTKDPKERNILSILSSIGQSFGIGVFCIGIFTLLIYPFLKSNPSYWLPVISIYAFVSFICIIFEYYFTLERNTEEERQEETMSLKQQIKALFSDKYWVIIALITLVYAFSDQVRSIAVIYYCEWTLGTYETYRNYYALIQLVGGLPLWIGAVVIKPIVERAGKQKTIFWGLLIALIGNLLEYFFMKNVYVVVSGAIIRNIGLVPISYVLTSLLADVMDDIGKRNGQRCDGAVMSADSALKTIFSGLGVGLFNLSLVIFGYQEPDVSLATQNAQNASMQNAFGFLFALIPALCCLIAAVLVLFLDIEKKNKAEEGKQQP
jgi:glycoside/pentoside/hexuronide:cation symporter, GPH family